MDSWANDFGGLWTLLFVGVMGWWLVKSSAELVSEWWRKHHDPHSQ